MKERSLNELRQVKDTVYEHPYQEKKKQTTMSSDQSWHWFVLGFMYRGQYQETPSHKEARKKFFEEYDKWVKETISSNHSGIIELCNKDTKKYGTEAD